MRRPPDDAIEAAWYTPAQFVEMARRERHSAEVRAMVRRRELFEARLAEADEPLSKEQRLALWDAADHEAKGDS